MANGKLDNFVSPLIELILLTLRRNNGSASFSQISDTLSNALGYITQYGVIYMAIQRLQDTGHINSAFLVMKKQTKGRRKRQYQITSYGVTTIVKMERIRKVLNGI